MRVWNWFLSRMLRISRAEKKPNKRVLGEGDTAGALIYSLRTRQATFWDHMMRREKLGHLVTTVMIEGKRDRVKQRESTCILDGLLTKWRGLDLGNDRCTERDKASMRERL